MERALQVTVTAAIVFICLAFAIPYCGCSRQLTNDEAAVANLRTINTAEVTYLSSSGGSYGSMTDLITAGLLDDTFIGTRAGYKYYITLDTTGSVYTANALPVSTNNGRFAYYSHPDAVVRYSTNASLAPAGQSGRSVQSDLLRPTFSTRLSSWTARRLLAR